jgi:hypothetical protein
MSHAGTPCPHETAVTVLGTGLPGRQDTDDREWE